MKLKYKKMIIMISMCTMGIGLVTFSITGQSKNSATEVEETAEVMDVYNAKAVAIIGDQNVLSATLPAVTPIPAVSSTMDATLEIEGTEVAKVAEVTNILETDSYKDINKLIKKYYNAKLTDDVKNFNSLVNDTSKLNMDDIKRKTKYIEEYKNFTCYTRKGPEVGSYIVYAYHEVKFSNIDTPAPGMNEFYVMTNESGDPYIYLGEIDKDAEQYMKESRESEDAMDLIYSVNEKLQKVRNSDTALNEFYMKLEESAKNITKND